MRSTVATALMVAICSGLTACAPTPPKGPHQEETMPAPQENRDALTALFDETQELLGVEWTNKDDTDPFSCDPVDGGEGVQYSRSREAEGSASAEEQKAIADQVAELWETRGYTTARSEHPNLGSEVKAHNDERSTLLFGINENAAILYGGSDCTPGDLSELMDELLNQDDAGLRE